MFIPCSFGTEVIVMTFSMSYSKQLFQELWLMFIFIYAFGTTKP